MDDREIGSSCRFSSVRIQKELRQSITCVPPAKTWMIVVAVSDSVQVADWLDGWMDGLMVVAMLDQVDWGNRELHRQRYRIRIRRQGRSDVSNRVRRS